MTRKRPPDSDCQRDGSFTRLGRFGAAGATSEDEKLASCYRRCLQEAAALGAETVAFPGISTGLHGFPVDRAASIAVTEVLRSLERLSLPRMVTFVCFDNASITAYERLLSER